ncbi:MAG: hypothetical protein C0602_06245 [Denitrovibrio sp.]|nr:MAG: hypothetical protein C0602_06245 [Denitrovibrio sp.]
MKINLNADMGESFGIYKIGNDDMLLDVIKSANIACGFHAGDPLVIANTIETALAKGVSLGAHPSYPDLHGFGRRSMSLSPKELKASIIYQVGALDGLASSLGSNASHVKPHGALNNDACENAEIAKVVAEAIYAYDRDIILLAPVLSELAKAGLDAGLNVAMEVFADRAYTDEGNLVSRSVPGAVLHDSDECLEHVLRMVEKRGLTSINGKYLPVKFHSICVHGDNAHAVDTALKVRQGLEAHGLNVVKLTDIDL